MRRLFNRRTLAVVLLAAGVTATGWVYSRANHAMNLEDPDRARRQGRPIPVRTTVVTQTEVEQVIGATALTTESSQAVIRALSPSGSLNTTDVIIRAVHVREGDRVSRGQLLFEIDDTLLRRAVRQNEETVAAARAELERVRKGVGINPHLRALESQSSRAELVYRTEDVDVRNQAMGMYSGLVQNKAASKINYLDSRSLYLQANYNFGEAGRRVERVKDTQTVGPLRDVEDVAKSQSSLVAATVALDNSRRDLEWARLQSPLDGFVDNKIDVTAGQVLTVTSPLARVIQIDPIHVRLDFPQERTDEVSVGQKVSVVLDSFPKETFEGAVIRISPVVNPQLRVFPVVVEIANPQCRIKSGVSGFARLRLSRPAVVVPATAVIQHEGKSMVFRVEAGRAKIREVRTKPAVALGTLEVTEGLSPGDEVVIYFANFYRHWGELTKKESYLQDNDAVDTDWRKWARRD